MKRYLTEKEHETLKKKIKYLETEKRKEVAEALKHAASFGDLSENASFDAAKEEQGFLEVKIAELKKFLSEVEIVKKKKTSLIQIGSTVLLESKGKKMKFEIVGMINDKIDGDKISYESPLGKALLGKKEGDKIKVETPSGKMAYKIFKVD
jgi:transcription elongation factor GreA